MFHRTVLLFLLLSVGVSSIFQETAIKHGAYGNIQGEVEYSPTIDDMIVADINEIHSMHQCAHHCMFNELCRTVTYYEDLKSCRLFSVSSSVGTITNRPKTKVIDFVDKMLSDMWYVTKNMTSVRSYAQSTFIPIMNAVQIIGGYDGSYELSSTEMFFISNGSFQHRADTFVKRFRHTVDYLNNRTIVVAGGSSAINTVEIYDPILGISVRSINMSASRAFHASSVIDQNKNSTTKLLLSGGFIQNRVLASGDVFNTETERFTAVINTMSSARYHHTATSIGNGYVLLAGGVNNNSFKLDTLELYNSTSNMFLPLSVQMSSKRAHHTATYIPSIQAVLIVGGWGSNQVLKTYDLFNVSTFSFIVLNGSTLNARAYHTATLLLDHRVLLIGGMNGQRLSSCELYDPVLGKFIAVKNMFVERADHTATLLANTGQVLVCGGQSTNGTMRNTCELYQP